MKIKQAKIFPLVGALQVQVQNSMFYITFINVFMLASTFWFTTGAPFVQIHNIKWFTFWHLMAIGVIGFLVVMLLDYKFMYPSRQAFVNKQSTIHANPAMDALLEVKDDIKAIKKQLEDRK